MDSIRDLVFITRKRQYRRFKPSVSLHSSITKWFLFGLTDRDVFTQGSLISLTNSFPIRRILKTKLIHYLKKTNGMHQSLNIHKYVGSVIYWMVYLGTDELQSYKGLSHSLSQERERERDNLFNSTHTQFL